MKFICGRMPVPKKILIFLYFVMRSPHQIDTKMRTRVCCKSESTDPTYLNGNRVKLSRRLCRFRPIIAATILNASSWSRSTPVKTRKALMLKRRRRRWRLGQVPVPARKNKAETNALNIKYYWYRSSSQLMASSTGTDGLGPVQYLPMREAVGSSFNALLSLDAMFIDSPKSESVSASASLSVRINSSLIAKSIRMNPLLPRYKRLIAFAVQLDWLENMNTMG